MMEVHSPNGLPSPMVGSSYPAARAFRVWRRGDPLMYLKVSAAFVRIDRYSYLEKVLSVQPGVMMSKY
jgi:hypothetical protein